MLSELAKDRINRWWQVYRELRALGGDKVQAMADAGKIVDEFYEMFPAVVEHLKGKHEATRVFEGTKVSGAAQRDLPLVEKWAGKLKEKELEERLAEKPLRKPPVPRGGARRPRALPAFHPSAAMLPSPLRDFLVRNRIKLTLFAKLTGVSTFTLVRLTGGYPEKGKKSPGLMYMAKVLKAARKWEPGITGRDLFGEQYDILMANELSKGMA